MWYVFFALTDFLLIIAIVKAHDVFSLRTSKVARFIMGNFLLLGFCQTLLYLDQAVILTGGLTDIYQMIVPTINMSYTLVISVYAIGAVFIKTRHPAKERTL